MTKPVRYQDGCLYVDHAAWFVKYRVRVRQEDGSIKLRQRAKMLGRVADYPRESDILLLKIEFMQRLNAGGFTPDSNMSLRDFVDKVYLPYIEELRELYFQWQDIGFAWIVCHAAQHLGPLPEFNRS